jgi:hypothetical protein
VTNVLSLYRQAVVQLPCRLETSYLARDTGSRNLQIRLRNLEFSKFSECLRMHDQSRIRAHPFSSASRRLLLKTCEAVAGRCQGEPWLGFRHDCLDNLVSGDRPWVFSHLGKSKNCFHSPGSGEDWGVDFGVTRRLCIVQFYVYHVLRSKLRY